MVLSASPASPPAFTAKQGFVFLLFFLILMGMGLAVPRALSFLPGLAGVCGFAFIWIKHRAMPALDITLLKFLAALSVFSLVSCLWAPDWEYSAGKSVKSMFLLLSCFMLLMLSHSIPRHVQHKDLIACVAGVICAIAGGVYFFEYQSNFMLTQFLLNMDPANLPASIKSGFLLNRSMVFLVLLCLPVLLALYQSGLQRRVKCMVIFCMAIGIVPALFVTQSQTAQIAACLAPLMFLYPAHKKKARRIFAAALITAMVAAPFAIMPLYESFEKSPAAKIDSGFMYQASIPHRLEVWNFISQKIMESPLFGHGIEATRFLKSDQILPRMESFSVLHPHNLVLQIWIEFGLAGVLLAAAFLVYLFKALDNKTSLAQRYYTVLLTVILAVMTIGYGLWQAWQIGMMFFVIALSVMVTRLYAPLSEKENGAIQK